VELVDENERLSMENKRIKEELDQGTSAKLHEYEARIGEMERNMAAVKQRRDALKAKFEYVSVTGADLGWPVGIVPQMLASPKFFRFDLMKKDLCRPC